MVPGAVPGTIGPRRYCSADILDRANRWAAQHGYPPVTLATLRELCKDRIVEGPRRRGRGQRRGAAQDWSASDYRRLLRVIALRARGIRRRVDQRVYLFAMRVDLPIEDVRAALREFYRANANRMNRELRTHFWPIQSIAPAVEKVTGEVFDVHRTDGFMARLDPDVRATAAQVARDLIAHPVVRRVMNLTADLLFRPEAEGHLRELPKALAQLPADLQPLLVDLTEFLTAGVGLLAPSDAGDEVSGNSIVEAIDTLSDWELVSLRDFVLGWNVLCEATVAALRTKLKEDLEPVEALLNNVLQAVSPALRLRSLDERIAFMGVMATFAARNTNWRQFMQVSVEWHIGPAIAALNRRGLGDDDSTIAAARDAALEAAGVRSSVRNLLHPGARAEPTG
jgi:hypothetical protein